MFRIRIKKRRNSVSRIIRDNYRGKEWYSTRKEVLARDNYECKGEKPSGMCRSKKNLDVHHIIPLSKGGETRKGNLITLCADCHSERHSHMKKR